MAKSRLSTVASQFTGTFRRRTPTALSSEVPRPAEDLDPLQYVVQLGLHEFILNGIVIGSAILSQLTVVFNTRTETALLATSVAAQ